MKSEAILTVIKYLWNFDPEKSSNPFSYITQICLNSFIGYITKQKKHSKIKNQLFDSKENFIEYDSSLAENDKALNYQEYIN